MRRIWFPQPNWTALVAAVCATAAAATGGDATSGAGAAPTRIAVCGVVGEGLPVSATTWLGELIRAEASVADSLETTPGLLDCADGIDTARARARAAGAGQLIVGRVAVLADLFVIDLSLVDATTGALEGRESVEIVASPLDPRTPVRVATQRLLSMGGVETLPRSAIHVSSTPAGAKVFVGGLLEGRAPLSLRVEPGLQSIKATLPGYAPWALDVDVKNGESLSLNAALDRALSATQYKSLGGQVILGFAVPYATVVGEALLYLADVGSGRPYLGWLLLAPPATYLIGSDKLGNEEIDVGRAWSIVSSGLWGATWGLLGMGSAGQDSPRPYVAVSVASSAIGMAIATVVTEGHEVNRKRVSLVNTGGFMGSAMGLGLPYLFDVRRPRVYNLSLLAGGVLGVVLTTRLTADLDYVQTGGRGARLQVQPGMWQARDDGRPGPQGQRAGSDRSSVRYGLLVRLAAGRRPGRRAARRPVTPHRASAAVPGRMEPPPCRKVEPGAHLRRGPVPSLFLIFALLALLNGCAHTHQVRVSPGMDPAPLRRLEGRLHGRTAQVELRDGRLFVADGLRLLADTTRWHAPRSGVPWAVPTTQVDCIRVDSRWRGALDGALIGVLVGAPVGVLLIDSGGASSIVVDRLGAALAGAYSLGIWGAGLGAIAGSTTTYVLVPDEPAP